MSTYALAPAPPQSASSRLFVRVREWAQRAAASWPVVLVLFTAVYLAETLRIAEKKLFWDDEFFTLYLSRIPTWHGLIQALSTGADQHPPSFYFLTHCFLSAFGTSPITLRLTALLGFWLLCVCLYAIVRSLTTPLWGVAAMVFPLSTNLSYYATEARGYGMVAGLASLALLSWLRVTRGQRRALFLPLLAISLAGAVGMHYYAAAVMCCLAAGELVRSRQRRRVDLPVFAALSAGLLPIAAFLPVIRQARRYSSHFWAVPVWSDAVTFYKAETGSALIVVLGLITMAMSLQMKFRKGSADERITSRLHAFLDPPQTVAVCSLAALPFLVMVGAKFVTHGFADRYAISAIVGITVLLCCFLHRVAPEPNMPLAAILACLLLSAGQVRAMNSDASDAVDATVAAQRLLTAAPKQPILLANAGTFYRLSFYAPRQFATRLEYIADPALSVQFLGQDTLDRGLLDLRPWFPLKAVTLDQFAQMNSSFTAYGSSDSWSWLTYVLPRLGQATLAGREHRALLFDVKGSNSTPIAEDEVLQPDMLYRHVSATGPSLCEVYMGPHHCL